MTENVGIKWEVRGGNKNDPIYLSFAVPTVLGRNPSVRRIWLQCVEQFPKGTEQNPHTSAAFYLESLCKVTSKQDQESLAGRGN